MKYKKDIQKQDVIVSLTDENGNEFFRAEFDPDCSGIFDVNIYDHINNSLLDGYAFEDSSKFIEWCDKTIEIIKVIQKEMAQHLPKRKPKSKKAR